MSEPQIVEIVGGATAGLTPISSGNPLPISGTVTSTPSGTQAVNLTQILGAAHSTANPIFAQLNGGYNPAAGMTPTNPIIATDVIFGDTVSKGGGAAAPTAGTAFVSYAANALSAGRHRVTVLFSISGAAEIASNGANVRLSDASGGFTAIDLPSNNGAAAGVAFGPFTFELSVAAANTVKLTAVANATASTVYAGTIIAKRIS